MKLAKSFGILIEGYRGREGVDFAGVAGIGTSRLGYLWDALR